MDRKKKKGEKKAMVKRESRVFEKKNLLRAKLPKFYQWKVWKIARLIVHGMYKSQLSFHFFFFSSNFFFLSLQFREFLLNCSSYLLSGRHLNFSYYFFYQRKNKLRRKILIKNNVFTRYSFYLEVQILYVYQWSSKKKKKTLRIFNTFILYVLLIKTYNTYRSMWDQSNVHVKLITMLTRVD